MTPYRTKRRGKPVGTFILDRQFDGVGRIVRHTRTTDKRTARAMDQMLDTLYATGRLDVLRLIRSGKLKLMVVFDAFRRGALSELPDAATGRPLASAYEAWRVDLEGSKQHRARLKQLGASLRFTDKDVIQDLPRLVKAYRQTARLQGHHANFAKAKEAASAFLRDELGKSHALWARVREIRPLPVTPKKGNPQSVDDARQIARDLGKHGPAWWAMCCTGMSQDEYFGRKWRNGSNYVEIRGTKAKGRKRRVPRLVTVPEPETETASGFAQALRKATNGLVTGHDPRRTFAHWMDEAGISRIRRNIYRGHGTKDIGDLYERHEVARFLDQDAAKLRAYLGEDRPALTVEQGGA